MPIITVETNLSANQLPGDFLPTLSAFSAETLDKPEQRISISLHTDRQLLRGGSPAPMMLIQIAAIDVISSAEHNSIHTPKFFKFVEQKTGLPADRIMVLFYPLNGWQVGVNGSIVS